MHKKLYSVFDSKVSAYTNPMVFRSAGEAIRAFGTLCSDTNHDFHLHAEDYTLFELGEWDELTGSLIPYHVGLSICKAIECSNSHRERYFAVANAKQVA